jgi:hypothetical protein
MSHEARDSPVLCADPELTPKRDARDTPKVLEANQSDENGSRITALPILSILLYSRSRLDRSPNDAPTRR